MWVTWPKNSEKNLFLDFYFFWRIYRSVYRPMAANGLKQCTVLYCTVQYGTVLYGTVLYKSVTQLHTHTHTLFDIKVDINDVSRGEDWGVAPVAVLDSSWSQIWGKIALLCWSVSVYWPIFHGCSPGGGGGGWGVMCTIYININHPRDAGHKTAGQL